MFLSNLFPWMGKGVAAGNPVCSVGSCPSPAPEPLRAVPASCASNKKRTRTSTPELVSDVFEETVDLRPVKLFKSETSRVPIHKKPSFVSKLPEDILEHALGFLGTVDRCNVQLVSKQFRKVSNRPKLLKSLDVSKIVQENDTPERAAQRLQVFADAGNLQALYMLGIIYTYCVCNVSTGLQYLKQAAAQNYVRASYALGLVLRDPDPLAADLYMKQAAAQNYLPALQELLSAREMKQKFGEPSSDVLCQHLDFVNLNLLLTRHYCSNHAQVRHAHTSHCWNPKCGRWAYKANAGVQNGVSRMKMCSRCCRAKYCSKLCQVYDWRSGRHKLECQFL